MNARENNTLSILFEIKQSDICSYSQTSEGDQFFVNIRDI